MLARFGRSLLRVRRAAPSRTLAVQSRTSAIASMSTFSFTPATTNSAALKTNSSTSSVTFSPFSVSNKSTQVRFFGGSNSHFLPQEEVEMRVLEVLKNFHKVDAAKVSPTCHFNTDLGLDSLDTVEVVLAFEDEFAIEFSDNEAEKILTAGDAISYICTHPNAK